MTTDRDVRLSGEQLHYLVPAVRARLRKIDRSIAAAEANRAAGATIQLGTLDTHHRERGALVLALASFEVARAAMAQRIADQLAAGRGAA